MMTGHVMELDSVSVEVVEDRQADLVTLSVVRLGPTRSGIENSFDICISMNEVLTLQCLTN